MPHDPSDTVLSLAVRWHGVRAEIATMVAEHYAAPGGVDPGPLVRRIERRSEEATNILRELAERAPASPGDAVALLAVVLNSLDDEQAEMTEARLLRNAVRFLARTLPDPLDTEIPLDPLSE